MLTLDTEQKQRQKKADGVLKNKDFVRSAIDTYTKNKEITVATDGGLCVSNLAEQLGTPISSAELEDGSG